MPILWPLIFKSGHQIVFAHTSFKWANLASHNAGVTVVIIGLSRSSRSARKLYSNSDEGDNVLKEADYINAYLVDSENVTITMNSRPLSDIHIMTKGNQPTDGGNLLLSHEDLNSLKLTQAERSSYIRPIYGSAEFIRGTIRYCIWVNDKNVDEVKTIRPIAKRIDEVREMRKKSPKNATIRAADKPHAFGEIRQTGYEKVLIVPSVSSESRKYLPTGYRPPGTIVSNLAFAILDAPLWNMALIASRIHLVWIATVCGKLETRYRYSNTLGWNTFPVPKLTEKNKADLTRCAENILLAREAHFPATIADLYDPEKMPADLKAAHDQNDEVLERIYIGRRFKNDTERLEKLFDMYTKMTTSTKKGAKS